MSQKPTECYNSHHTSRASWVKGAPHLPQTWFSDSQQREYDIKVDLKVPPVQHVRRKVSIEIKTAIKEATECMVQQDILKPQIEPTPWVSSVTYPVKPTGEVRPYLDVRDPNKAIIRKNHKPQTFEEIAHQLAGAVVFTKADTLKAFFKYT